MILRYKINHEADINQQNQFNNLTFNFGFMLGTKEIQGEKTFFKKYIIEFDIMIPKKIIHFSQLYIVWNTIDQLKLGLLYYICSLLDTHYYYYYVGVRARNIVQSLLLPVSSS